MVTMDFKGITWLGNVYQKFEAMCLEVEEIIVQDTAKYIEDQVQTVGASVKKFYADAVQDLDPKSSVDSAKLSATSTLHEFAPVCSLEKKRESTGGEATKVPRELLTKDDTWVIHDEVKRDCRYRRTKLGAKRISRKGKSSTDMGPRVGKDSSLRITCIPESKDLESSHGKKTIRSNDTPTEVSRRSSTEESFVKNENEAVESTRGRPEIEQPVTTSLSTESNDCAKEADETSSDGNSVSALQQKIIQHCNHRPLEESCILVDSNEAHWIVPHKSKNGKHKPYKMIRDALSTRISARKQEYKRLAHQWHAEDAELDYQCVDNPKLFDTEETQRPVCQTSDSDWEVLSV